MSSVSLHPAETSPDAPRTIVRHRAHELRNILNGLDLHAQLLAEMLQEPDTLEIIRQMRRQIEDLEDSIKWLSFQFAEPAPDIVVARDLVTQWQQTLRRLTHGQRHVEWSTHLASETVRTDPRPLVAALRELATEAWRKPPLGPLRAEARADAQCVTLALAVPGTTVPPLTGTLAEVRHVLERNGATFELGPLSGDSGWVATIRFPMAQ